MTARDPQVQTLTAALAEPFEPREVKWKPQSVKGNRCLAMCYIDARLIQDRLDEVLGVENWQDSYKLLPDGSVVCRLRCKLGDHWVSKTDVGSPSEQPDGGDRLKAAFSDALKRAAVKFGIGRYLYRMPAQWVDYDPVKKQLVQVPQMPPFGIPKVKAPAVKPEQPKPTPTAEAPKAAGGQHTSPAPNPALQLRAQRAKEFGECKTRKDYAGVCDAIREDMRAERLTETDRLFLTSLSEQTAARVDTQNRAGSEK